jgi:hypothetical protein
LVTLVFVTITIWLLKGVTFHHWAYLPPAIIVTTALHAMLRIALTYRAKDFTANMLRSVVYMFVIWLRAVFTLFGHTWSPTYSSWHRSARPGCSPPAFHRGRLAARLWILLSTWIRSAGPPDWHYHAD